MDLCIYTVYLKEIHLYEAEINPLYEMAQRRAYGCLVDVNTTDGFGSDFEMDTLFCFCYTGLPVPVPKKQ